MRSSFKSTCILGGCIGLLVALCFMVARADGDLGRSAYRRPAALREAAPAPDEDPLWRLGERLFFDPQLSASRTLACSSCHQPDVSWTDHRALAQGEGAQPLTLRAPTLLNVGDLDRLGWIGRFADIEAVSFFAMTSTTNMNMPVGTILGRLRQDPAYVAAFADTFGAEGVTQHRIGAALRRFVGTIVSAPAPFDRWVEGDAAAISPVAQRGFAVFNGKGRCAECHAGWAFTDGSFHDIGLAKDADVGRGALFKTSVKLQHAYKTPTLRNAAVRAPYMHDGKLATLAAVIEHYDSGGIARPSRAETIGPLHLDEREKADLLAFLETLTSPTDFRTLGDKPD